jgi:GAF domain-containing protein
MRISDAVVAAAGADVVTGADDVTRLEVIDPPAADSPKMSGEPGRILWPFSSQYAQTRLRAAAMGRAARWTRAPSAPDEAARVAALRALGLSPAVDGRRFARLTRMATIAFRVPVAFVGVIDADSQRMLSCVGAEIAETSREVAFCAHTILGDGPMVVSDALLDDRFAENPLVTDGPRLRFYAGCPLRAPGGAAVGTFCLVDMRPRDLGPAQRKLLTDFAALAERALRETAAA